MIMDCIIIFFAIFVLIIAVKPFETANHSKPSAFVGPWAALGDLAKKSLLILTAFRRIFHGSY